jgi:hypothetical protein
MRVPAPGTGRKPPSEPASGCLPRSSRHSQGAVGDDEAGRPVGGAVRAVAERKTRAGSHPASEQLPCPRRHIEEPCLCLRGGPGRGAARRGVAFVGGARRLNPRSLAAGHRAGRCPRAHNARPGLHVNYKSSFSNVAQHLALRRSHPPSARQTRQVGHQRAGRSQASCGEWGQGLGWPHSDASR